MFPRFRKEDTSASRQHGTKSGQCPPESQPDERVVGGTECWRCCAEQCQQQRSCTPLRWRRAASCRRTPPRTAPQRKQRRGCQRRTSATPPPRVDVEPTADTVESDQNAEVSAERCHRFVW